MYLLWKLNLWNWTYFIFSHFCCTLFFAFLLLLSIFYFTVTEMEKSHKFRDERDDLKQKVQELVIEREQREKSRFHSFILKTKKYVFVFGFCSEKIRKSDMIGRNDYTPHKLCVCGEGGGGYTVFMLSVFKSVTFWPFFNILKGQWGNFIKLSKHIDSHKMNICNRTVRARAQFY